MNSSLSNINFENFLNHSKQKHELQVQQRSYQNISPSFQNLMEELNYINHESKTYINDNEYEIPKLQNSSQDLQLQSQNTLYQQNQQTQNNLYQQHLKQYGQSYPGQIPHETQNQMVQRLKKYLPVIKNQTTLQTQEIQTDQYYFVQLYPQNTQYFHIVSQKLQSLIQVKIKGDFSKEISFGYSKQYNFPNINNCDNYNQQQAQLITKQQNITHSQALKIIKEKMAQSKEQQANYTKEGKKNHVQKLKQNLELKQNKNKQNKQEIDEHDHFKRIFQSTQKEVCRDAKILFKKIQSKKQKAAELQHIWHKTIKMTLFFQKFEQNLRYQTLKALKIFAAIQFQKNEQMDRIKKKNFNNLSQNDIYELKTIAYQQSQNQVNYQITRPFYFEIPTYQKLQNKIKEIFIERKYETQNNSPLIKKLKDL
ncbi:hypothetical protein PPERSA_05460 [Pseudocohnilembus persalinus]|uniref:Uncharacterized protein n=1 Tax=Pseudocohnilembus persalinus TaxID=266149 RepID=A0A0V0R8D7_PSEPJ|nr:hypothetical protein PPERSA_05460 [Pseudocohnilembus persalinus]|eukprot:KRX10640.1 hypothetical protein PPERSA_05460 [Pseudocohnilembus persalinus]